MANDRSRILVVGGGIAGITAAIEAAEVGHDVILVERNPYLGGRVAQMLRISLDNALSCIPEVSANKYALNIRFVTADYAAKTSLYDNDVPFDLTFCSL